MTREPGTPKPGASEIPSATIYKRIDYYAKGILIELIAAADRKQPIPVPRLRALLELFAQEVMAQDRKTYVRRQKGVLQQAEQAMQLAYEHLACADCTPDNYTDCSRHFNLHIKANQALSNWLTWEKKDIVI